MNVVELYINSINAERLEKERVKHQLNLGILREINSQQILDYIQDSVKAAVEPFLYQQDNAFNQTVIRAVVDERLHDIQMRTGIDFHTNILFHDDDRAPEISLDIRRPYEMHAFAQNIKF